MIVRSRVSLSVLFLTLLGCAGSGRPAMRETPDAFVDAQSPAGSDAAPLPGEGSLLDAATHDDAGAATNEAGTSRPTDAAVAAPLYVPLPDQPDTPLTKVSDCRGQPDLTLCDVATLP